MGILRRIFGGGEKKPAETTMSRESAIEIIQTYGEIMETSAPAPGCVADASKLPYTKERIKQALILGLKTNADPHMKEMLKVGYVQLADWQDG